MIFKDKVTVVTGASQGIGETIARDFAAEGAVVVLVDIQKEKLEAVAASIKAAGGRASVREANVAAFAQAEAAPPVVQDSATTSWSTTPASPATTFFSG